jgi:hypothetical protein
MKQLVYARHVAHEPCRKHETQNYSNCEVNKLFSKQLPLYSRKVVGHLLPSFKKTLTPLLYCRSSYILSLSVDKDSSEVLQYARQAKIICMGTLDIRVKNYRLIRIPLSIQCKIIQLIFLIFLYLCFYYYVKYDRKLFI